MERDLLHSARELLKERLARGYTHTYKVRPLSQAPLIPPKCAAPPPAQPLPAAPPLFALHPPAAPHSPSFVEIEKTLQRVAPHFSSLPTELPVMLFASVSSNEARSFLEKLGAAIGKVQGSCLLVTTLSSPPLCRLLIAPLSRLGIEGLPHLLTESHGGIPTLPLAEIEEYLQNQELKRALWTTIKALPTPNTPPSSSN